MLQYLQSEDAFPIEYINKMRNILFTTAWLLLTGLSTQLPQNPSDTVIAQVPEKTPVAAPSDASYWLADIKHQGIAAFNQDPSGYKVFRNVKDYGAKGMSCFHVMMKHS